MQILFYVSAMYRHRLQIAFGMWCLASQSFTNVINVINITLHILIILNFISRFTPWARTLSVKFISQFSFLLLFYEVNEDIVLPLLHWNWKFLRDLYNCVVSRCRAMCTTSLVKANATKRLFFIQNSSIDYGSSVCQLIKDVDTLPSVQTCVSHFSFISFYW